VPKPEVNLKLDHFIGAGEQRWRNGQFERFGGRQV
jgi:hypothetical protein